MMKQIWRRLGAVLAALVLICSVLPMQNTVSAETDWAAEGYVAIGTASELNNLIRKQLDGKFYLTGDIVFKESDFEKNGDYYNDGALWLPLGPTYSERFTGVFDGNGYTISGLKIALSSGQENSAYAGLFGYSSGKIRNLRMLNTSIEVKDSTYAYAGAVAGAASGTISNCYVLAGSVAVTNAGVTANAGGVVGRMYAGTISKCYNGAAVTANGTMAIAGGIAAQGNATLDIVANQGNITAKSPKGDAYSGGIVGMNDNTVSNALNRGAVEVSAGADGYGGGIVGANRAAVKQAVNIGAVKVTAKSHLFGGAIAGHSEGGTLKSTYYLDTSYDTAVTESTQTATELTTAQMGNKASFGDLDFDEVWSIAKSAPVLQALESARMVVTGIKITKKPKQMDYNEGQAFDPTGMEVTAYYEDGTTKVLGKDDYVVTGYNSQSPGKKELTISYNGYTATLSVTVREKVLDSIAVDPDNLPRTLYGLGEEFDVTGGVILAKFDNGATIRYSMTAKMISGFDNTKLGKQTLTITFGEKTTKLEVTVQKDAPPTTTTATSPNTVITGTLPAGSGAIDSAGDTLDDTSGGDILIDDGTRNEGDSSSSPSSKTPAIVWVAVVLAVLVVIAAGTVGILQLHKSGKLVFLHPDARHDKRPPQAEDIMQDTEPTTEITEELTADITAEDDTPDSDSHE